ncbi:hypothetical protein FKW77_008164 [Venturia effusa]|uniref:Uncharacterized protein n=1 Tax=Venturia effusa TaxID=50376 RepID=A0A517L7S7_9PEZI|nr:hypothetical protein FKW77_008164 [Venturia effusa]
MDDRFNIPPRKLHYSTIISFLFGIAFCLPHGIVTGEVAPALGLLPLGIGALLAFYRISQYSRSNNKKTTSNGAEYQILLPSSSSADPSQNNNDDKTPTWKDTLLALLDFGCFGGLIVTVAFSIVYNNGVRCRYSYRRERYNGVRYSSSYASCRDMQPMLAAWATMVMLVNA